MPIIPVVIYGQDILYAAACLPQAGRNDHTKNNFLFL